MNKHLLKLRQIGIVALLTAFFGMAGCQSTDETVATEECREASTETCEENGEDRGYDPCRINNNLPVCKE